MKVIFLDVDGVLTSEDYLNGRELDLDENKIRILKTIQEKTASKIVLSSSWRHHKGKSIPNKLNPYDVLEKLLLKNGLTIYDITPTIKKIKKVNNHIMFYPIVNTDSKRGEEILSWINQNHPESFLIIDDNVHDYQECNLENNLLKTSYYDGGLKQEHIEKALEILNNENKKIK